MKILVTGSTGFLGSHCVAALHRAGHELRLLARTPEKVPAIFASRGIEIEDVVKGDMADVAAVKHALNGCDGVLHAAATFYGGADILAQNISGVRNVLGEAAEMGLDAIVYISSITAMFPCPGDVMTVEDPVSSFDTIYGRSKAEGEIFARGLQKLGAPVTILYPGGVFGPEDPVPGETTKGLRDTLQLFFPVTTGGNAIVDVRDVAEIVSRCMAPGMGPRRYMLGGHFVTWAEYVNLCDEVTGVRVRRFSIPPQLMLLLGRSLDLAKKFVYFDYPLTYEAAQYLTSLGPCDSRSTCEDFDFEFRPTRETLADAIRWLVREGHLGPKRAGRLAGEA